MIVTIEMMREEIPTELKNLSDKAVEAVWLYLNGLYTLTEILDNLTENEKTQVNAVLELL